MNHEITLELTENWYAEPFTKRTSCEVPGQCGGDCNCGCPYNTMDEVERLPLIEEITNMFPNEWLTFIVPAAEDDDREPIHGKLVAHSPNPDEIFDATNAVLWNQCVYTFFNGDFEAMLDSYGDQLEDGLTVTQVVQPKSEMRVPPATEPVPDKLLDLIYSAIDQLYAQPTNISESIRRLRVAKVRLNFNQDNPLSEIVDMALDNLEMVSPNTEAIIWQLEDSLAELEAA